MLSQDLRSCAISLGVLAGQVTEEQWSFLRMLQDNLRAHADEASAMEENLTPPDLPEKDVAMPLTGEQRSHNIWNATNR